ncbi:hypothetical protein P9J65_04230 [Corynebacterium pseudotuberculosis]|uniref:hypothetical protein n=1 Tax=Corynebacterium pseudotuberculosis TaxID=1719 RepID=UPI00241744E2|nr:hypothetical protein [Corynebacterium pseudotuberculosis]WFP67978.1 hypothetical protein P8128_04230 [Corynebacterium pseudotuberculosis]
MMFPQLNNVAYMKLPLFHMISAAHHSAEQRAAHIRRAHPESLAAFHSTVSHPRSLARSLPTWRPPSIKVVSTLGSGELNLTITRHRVGPRARSLLQAYGISRSPAYLVQVRITNPQGLSIPPEVAEGWIRAIIPPDRIACVHELTEKTAPTFLWIVDSDFQPLPSPASIFQGEPKAA